MSICRQESGQSIVIVVISMTVIILIAAFAVDVAGWFAKRHQAQVTADAAALAAANYMSLNATVSNSSSTATTTATTYAQANGLPIRNSNVSVDTTADKVTVTVPTAGSLTFGGISLGSGPVITATAVASWQHLDCTSSGSNCVFAFAADNSCNGSPAPGTTGVTDSIGAVNHGVSTRKKGTGNGPSITGEVLSASGVTSTFNGNPKYDSTAVYPTTDSSNNSCVGANSPTPAHTKPFAAVINRAVASQFPIDYRLIYSACGTTSTKFGQVNCDANGYPNYCTLAVEGVSNVTSVASNDVYCNAGSGASVNTGDPSTWNGTTAVSGGGNGTFIAGTVDFNYGGNSTIAPAAGTTLLAYAADCNNSSPLPSTCPTGAHPGTTTTAPAIDLSGSGSPNISGDLFAPAGVVAVESSGTPTLTGMLEGWDAVYDSNGTGVGEGPPVNNQGFIIGDYLIQ